MSYTTSRDVWLAFEHNLSSISHVQAAQLHTELETTCKGVMSAKDYFLSIKYMVDELAFVGHPLTCNDILTYVLNCFGQEYNSLGSISISHSKFVSLESFICCFSILSQGSINII